LKDLENKLLFPRPDKRFLRLLFICSVLFYTCSFAISTNEKVNNASYFGSIVIDFASEKYKRGSILRQQLFPDEVT